MNIKRTLQGALLCGAAFAGIAGLGHVMYKASIPKTRPERIENPEDVFTNMGYLIDINRDGQVDIITPKDDLNRVAYIAEDMVDAIKASHRWSRWNITDNTPRMTIEIRNAASRLSQATSDYQIAVNQKLYDDYHKNN